MRGKDQRCTWRGRVQATCPRPVVVEASAPGEGSRCRSCASPHPPSKAFAIGRLRGSRWLWKRLFCLRIEHLPHDARAQAMLMKLLLQPEPLQGMGGGVAQDVLQGGHLQVGHVIQDKMERHL